MDANLQGDKTRHVLDLARRLDILGIVETHDDGFRGRYIQTELMESHNCAWHPLSIDGRAGGCALLVKRSLMSKFDTIRFPRHTPGRHLEAQLRGPAGNLVVHLLHIDPSLSPPDRVQELRRLHSLLLPRSEALTFIMGDFNFELGLEDRI